MAIYSLLLKCRNPLANAVFKKIIWLLENEIRDIRKIKNLLAPDTKELLDGLLMNQVIYIRANLNKEEKIKTLIHELAHYLFTESKENEIQKIEEILWVAFSKKQKSFLYKYVPKTNSEKLPPKV